MVDLTRGHIDQLTDDELRDQYDQSTRFVAPGLSFWRDELWLREQRRSQERALNMMRDANRQTATIRRLTWTITALTIAVVVMTGLNVWIALG